MELAFKAPTQTRGLSRTSHIEHLRVHGYWQSAALPTQSEPGRDRCDDRMPSRSGLPLAIKVMNMTFKEACCSFGFTINRASQHAIVDAGSVGHSKWSKPQLSYHLQCQNRAEQALCTPNHCTHQSFRPIASNDQTTNNAALCRLLHASDTAVSNVRHASQSIQPPKRHSAEFGRAGAQGIGNIRLNCRNKTFERQSCQSYHLKALCTSHSGLR